MRPPQPREAVVTAIEYHDAGWSMHDDKPTLNDAHEPATFYEMPVPLALRMWVGSVSAVAARGGPMAGLIVSWHFTTLAGLAPIPKEQESVQTLVAEFLVAQRARRVDYCNALGLSRSMAECPPRPVTIHDHEVVYNLWLLRMCDWLSLILCDDALPEMVRRPPAPSPGATAIATRWVVPGRLTIEPWPLAVPKLELSVIGRQAPFGPYRRNADLIRAYQQGIPEKLSFTVAAG